MKVEHYFRILSFTIAITLCSASISKSNNNFANKLYTALASKNKNDNVFFSPISLHTVLTLLYQSANGSTADVLQSVLNVSTVTNSAIAYKSFLKDIANKKDTDLYLATSIYAEKDQQLNAKFQAAAEKYFMATVQNIDFENSELAARQINSWVKKRTRNYIKEIVTPDLIESETLLLLNALYFKGSWMNAFQKSSTKTERFFVSSAKTINCQMMHISEKYYYTENKQLNAKILKIPYKKPQVKLIIVLPNAINGIRELEKKIVDKSIFSFLRDMKKQDVELFLPKFELTSTMDLSEPLTELGLGVIFSDKAEFPEMFNSSVPAQVSAVFQKAFITVNENGTEASAASGLKVVPRRMLSPKRRTIMRVDHPFIIYITLFKNKKPYILFMGKVVDPE